MKYGWIACVMVLAGFLPAVNAGARYAQTAGSSIATQSANRALAGTGISPVVSGILAALRSVEERRLWPGFDLRQVPIAIFDGKRTYLFRHPAPPAEFASISGTEGLRVTDGQYSQVRANTSMEIGGVLTATYLATADTRPAMSAAVIAHEGFHVYQRQHYPGWQTNEMNLFTYPSDDANNLGHARIEAMLLERAVGLKDLTEAACWASAAMKRRAQRFAVLAADAADYERGAELVEGTASLVQQRAGDKTQPSISASGFAADATRKRAYASGRMIGLLLDRLDPGWEQRLNATKVPVLGEILTRALPNAGGDCTISANKEAAQMQAAAGDVAAFAARREAVRREFDEAPGWTVLFRIPEGSALQPQGFDPMNVVRLNPRDVLHTRWLKTGAPGAVIEVLNRKALTQAAGDHPLFSGFREIKITGLPAEPIVTPKNGGIDLEADGLKAALAKAIVQRSNQTITIIINAPQ